MLACACVFALTAPTVAVGAGLAFAKVSTQVVSFPAGDPSSAISVGTLTDTLSGMDFDPAAQVLWAINFTGQTLGTVNQSTAAYTPTVALQGGCCITAFTIDPVDGTFYVSKTDALIYSLDQVSGQTTVRGYGALAGDVISALAADCSGHLFALAGTNLYQAHLGVDNPALIGSPGFAGPTNLEFDNQTGILYAWFLPTGGGNTTSTHVVIDVATGHGTATAQGDGRYRMAIRSECSIFANGFDA